jgi:TP901 family phage tail tape measure protein
MADDKVKTTKIKVEADTSELKKAKKIVDEFVTATKKAQGATTGKEKYESQKSFRELANQTLNLSKKEADNLLKSLKTEKSRETIVKSITQLIQEQNKAIERNVSLIERAVKAASPNLRAISNLGYGSVFTPFDMKDVKVDVAKIARERANREKRERIEAYRDEYRKQQKRIKELEASGTRGLGTLLADQTYGSNIFKRGLRWWKSEEGPKSFMADTRNRFATSVSWKLANLPLNTLDATWEKIKDGVKISARYEDALAKTQAIAGSTAGTLRDLANAVYEVGSNSRYTNDELIETTTILAQAGYSAKEIETLLGTVSRLASATGTDAKTSVDLLTSSMSLWNAQTSDAAQMADVLTVAVNKTKAEINSIQRGLQYAGAAASQMGMSFEETVAAMSAVTNAGLKTRSIMGTGLRALLTELSNPAKKFQTELAHVGLTMDDVNVRTLGLSKVMDNLQKAGFGAENAFRGLDRQAASFYLALKSQSDLFNRLPEDMKARGAAAEAEAKRMDTLLAQWTRMKNLGSELSAWIGTPFVAAFKKAAEVTNDFLEVLAKATRYLSGLRGKDLEAKVESAVSEVDSYTQKISSLADEMERLSRDSKLLSGDPEAIKTAHISLAEKFDKEGKSVRNLSTSYAELVAYMRELLEISANERFAASGKALLLASKQKTEITNTFNAGEWIFGNQYRGGFDRRPNEDLIRKAKGNKYNTNWNNRFANLEYFASLSGYSGKLFDQKSFGEFLNTLSSSDLQRLIFEYQKGRPKQIEDDKLLGVLTALLPKSRDVDRLRGQFDKDYRSTSEYQLNTVTSAQTFFGEKQAGFSDYKKGLASSSFLDQIKNYLSSIKEARSTLKTVEDLTGNEEEKRTIGGSASTYIQSLVSALSETLANMKKEMEKNLEKASNEKKQKIKEEYIANLDAFMDILSGDQDVLAEVIALIDKEKGVPEDVKENLKSLLDKSEEKLVDILKSRLEAEIREAKEKSNKKETKHQRKMREIRGQIAEVGLSPEDVQSRRSEELGEKIAEQDYDIKIAAEGVKNIEKQRDTKYARYSDAEFNLALDVLKAWVNELRESRVSLDLTKKKLDFEKEKTTLDYALGLSSSAQSLLASGTSLKIAQMKDSRYGLSKRWNALDSITAATMNREVLESERRRIERDYKTRIESPYFASLSATEKQNAQTEYENALRQNEEALLQNTQALREATEQRERETEGTEGFERGKKDFFESIPTESASYAMTLEALNSTSNGLKTAFKEIAVNGMKASDAFKQMAQSILQSLANKAIDKGVDYMMSAIGAAINLGTPALMQGANGSGSSGKTDPNRVPLVANVKTGSTGGFVSYNGIKKFATGGTAGKDSVPALLMPGEYVMKKSAVDMIGKDTLDAMNNAATRMHKEDRSSGRVREKSSKPVVTNVYVVSDPKEAGMTPNDVVVAIGRDILQGGQTRQLIQQVVQGQY